MHVTPEAALQQSLVMVQRSPFCEQPFGIDWQVAPPGARAA